jgi:ribosome-associated protein
MAKTARSSINPKRTTARLKALKLVDFVLSKKAKDPLILDLRRVSNLCDYFVICSGETSKQVRAVYEEVIKKCYENKIDIHHCEDDSSGQWLLIDLFDVILHIFIDEARSFYNLEYLWKEAKRLRIVKR